MESENSFDIARQEHEEFLQALGELTLAWSDLETVLVKVLANYAGVTAAVSRAIFSGTRARQAMKFVMAIADNTVSEQHRRDDIEEIFNHIATLNTSRDFVIHNVDGSMQTFRQQFPTSRLISNAERSSRAAKAKTIFIGSSDLLAMAADCIECCWRLHAHLVPISSPFQPAPGTGGVRSPWQYSPPQPAGQNVPINMLLR